MKQALKRLLVLQHIAIGFCIVTFTLLAKTSHATEFDHQYNEYNALLQSVVQVSDTQLQTRVNYQLLSEKHAVLARVLTSFFELSQAEYEAWDKDRQLSFLINAYNAITLQLIVDNWDAFTSRDAQSIRDLGGFFTSPWEKKFFTLFDKKHTLDDIEHNMIRKWFKEPRIHAALVCAAVSCPPLRNEAFTAQSLDTQLNKQMYMFLADNSRNEIIVKNGQISAALSPIFKWYKGDFEKGDGGFNSLYDVLLAYADALVQGDNNAQEQRKLLLQSDYPIIYKDYDWRLNDVANF